MFEVENTLQHPYEFVEKIHYNIPMNQKQEFQIFLTFWCESKSKARSYLVFGAA